MAVACDGVRRLKLSDGVHAMQAMLTANQHSVRTRAVHAPLCRSGRHEVAAIMREERDVGACGVGWRQLVHEGRLVELAIIKLTEFSCSTVQTTRCVASSLI